MYKRPSQRVKVHTSHIRGSIPDDTFIGRITKHNPVIQFKFVKEPVYHQDDYLKLLEANYKKMGLPYVDPQLPIVQPRVYPEPPKEPELTFGDRVQVNLRVLKSGIVRVKINSAIAELYDKYYKHAKRPPFKMVLQAYKSHGFSKEFLQRIEKNNEKRKREALRIEKIFAKIFTRKRIKMPGQSQCSSGSNIRTGLDFIVNESCVPLQFRHTVPSSVPVCNSTVEMNQKYRSVILNSNDQSK